MTTTHRRSAPVVLCGRPTRRGTPCGHPVLKGATVCWTHGGAAPQVRRKAAVRAEVQAWGLDAPEVDPAQTLLRLLAQSAARVARYGALLAAAYDGAEDFPERFAGSGVAALIGHRYAATMAGGRVEVGEAVRGLVELEAEERDRCARFAKLALDAGLEERLVRLAESEASLVVDAMRVLVDGLLARGLVDPARRGEVLELSAGALRQVEGEVVERG